MKTLQEQYNLIKEGKGDKTYFMKLARYNFPDLVTPVLSYNDTITVLKNKSILSEGISGVVTAGKKQDWHAIFNENMNSLNELEKTQMGMYLMFNKKTGKLENYMESPDHKENNNLKKQIEDKGQYVLHFITGNDYNKFKNSLDKYKGKTRQELDLFTDDEMKMGAQAVDMLRGATISTMKESGDEDDDEKYKEKIDQYEKREKDIEKFGLQHLKHLKEAKEAKAEEKETTKEVTDMATRGYDYKDPKNYDNVFGEEFLKGYYTEMKDPKNVDKDVEELRAIVAKNLAKDLSHYVKDGQFGVKGLGYITDAPGLGEPKPITGPHKSSGYGNLKESVLRSQIYLLVKEVLAEGENKDLLKHRLGVLKKALEIAKKDLTKVEKGGKAYKEVEKTIAAKKREIEALEKEILDEAKKPSAGLTKKEKSAISKKAHAGKDIGKKGKGFEKVAKAAEKQYGSKEAGEKVAAAAMWKSQAAKKK